MPNPLVFQYYLVVFLDHLGQRERLRKITEIPANDAEKQIFIEKIKESFGRVDIIRKSFKSYFNSNRSHQPDITLVPPELQNEFLLSRKQPDLTFYGLSDAIVIAVPLTNENENCTAMNGIRSALFATSAVTLVALSNGIPIRAGLDIGIAAKIDDNEIYGPALERAFYLESNLAEYPRLITGQELLNYLFYIETQEYTTKIGSIAKEIAKFCRTMIIQDTDGRFMLDFLHEIIKEASGSNIDKALVESALKFVTSEYEKYLKEDNELLASRYYRLLSYFNSRKGIWGVS